MAEPWLSDDEQRVWRSWLRAQLLVQAAVGCQLHHGAGLSAGDYAVLVHLSEAPDGRLRGMELARALEWEKSRLSHHLTRMQRRGLVARVECPTDGRGAFVVITPEGRSRIEAAAPMHAAEVRRVFVEALGPVHLRALGEATERLIAAIEPACATADTAPGDCPDGSGDEDADA